MVYLSLNPLPFLTKTERYSFGERVAKNAEILFFSLSRGFFLFLFLSGLILSGSGWAAAPDRDREYRTYVKGFWLTYLPLTANAWISPGPPAGNPDGHCSIPAEAGEEDASHAGSGNRKRNAPKLYQ